MDAVLPPAAAFRRAPSALDAVAPALQNVKRVLFSPFSARKWLLLGLIAFLAGVAGGGGGGKADLAQAGGKYKDKVDEALRLAKTLI